MYNSLVMANFPYLECITQSLALLSRKLSAKIIIPALTGLRFTN